MRSLTEPAAGLRVLMRMPDLSPNAVPAKPAPEREMFVQQPLAPLPPPEVEPAKHPNLPESRGVTPEELQSTGSFKRSLAVLAVLAVAGLVGVSLSKRGRQPEAAPPVPESALVTPEVEFLPGGSPTAITQAPEMAFPTEAPNVPAVEAGALQIQRLPSVAEQTSTAQAPMDGTTAQVGDGAGVGLPPAPQPIVARLESRIEQPQPQVSR